MRRYNPYKNIFYYYRGPSINQTAEFDKQIEDNSTKALINLFENCSHDIVIAFLNEVRISINTCEKVSYDLQVANDESRPDALIIINGQSIFIESKIDSPLDKNQIFSHLQSGEIAFLICHY